MSLLVELASTTGTAYGRVIKAKGRGVTRGLKRPRTARFTVEAGDPLRARLRQTSQTLVKVYDQGYGVGQDGSKRLLHVGPITAYERDDNDGGLTVSIGSTGPEWRLQRRLARKLTAGPVTLSNPALLRGAYMAALITDLNGTTASGHFAPLIVGDTGIRPRTIATTPAYGAADFTWKAASQILTELGAGIDGPDWHVYPVEPIGDAAGVQIGALDVAPVIGSLRPAVAFTYGFRKNNVASYKEVLDPTAIVSVAAHLAAGFPDASMPVIERTNAATIAAFGILETLVAAGDLVDATLRTTLLDDHLAVRASARQIIQFTVAEDVEPDLLDLSQRRVPRPGIDYDIGDIVGFAAVEKIPLRSDDGTLLGFTDETVLDVLVRIYNIDISDDEAGKRTVTLTTIAE